MPQDFQAVNLFYFTIRWSNYTCTFTSTDVVLRLSLSRLNEPGRRVTALDGFNAYQITAATDRSLHHLIQ